MHHLLNIKSDVLTLNWIHRKKLILAIVYERGVGDYVTNCVNCKWEELNHLWSLPKMWFIKFIPTNYCLNNEFLHWSVWAAGILCSTCMVLLVPCQLYYEVERNMVWEVFRLNVSFINFSLRSRQLFSNVLRLGSLISEHGCNRSWVSGTVLVSRDKASGAILDAF